MSRRVKSGPGPSRQRASAMAGGLNQIANNLQEAVTAFRTR